MWLTRNDDALRYVESKADRWKKSLQNEYEHGELVQQMHQGVELEEGISKLRRRDNSPRLTTVPCILHLVKNIVKVEAIQEKHAQASSEKWTRIKRMNGSSGGAHGIESINQSIPPSPFYPNHRETKLSRQMTRSDYRSNMMDSLLCQSKPATAQDIQK